MAFTIYLVECPAGRFYVGCTSKSPADRLRTHEAYGRTWPGFDKASLGDAISYFGRQSLRLRTLAIVESADDAAAIETLMIARYGSASPTGYNAMKTSHYRTSRYNRQAA